jgi:hypothetical protein
MIRRASVCLLEPWQRARITSRTNTWTRRSLSATTACPPVSHAANSATPQRMYGASSSQPRHISSPWMARPSTDDSSTDYDLGGGLHGRLVDFKGESGTTSISYDTNIVCYAFGRRAWVSVCSVSVFTTKTSGVQHQIQDAFLKSRLCRSNSTWSTSLLSSSSRLVAAGCFPLPL